jgi:hypothetical protein
MQVPLQMNLKITNKEEIHIPQGSRPGEKVGKFLEFKEDNL